MSFGGVEALKLLVGVLVFILDIFLDTPEGQFFDRVDGLVLIDILSLCVADNSFPDLFEIGVQHPSNKLLTNTQNY